jgi:hypothetical protein
VSHNDGFVVAPERRLKELSLRRVRPRWGERRGDPQRVRYARGLLWFFGSRSIFHRARCPSPSSKRIKLQGMVQVLEDQDQGEVARELNFLDRLALLVDQQRN